MSCPAPANHGVLRAPGVQIVIVIVNLGTALNMFTTLAIYRYCAAIMAEVKAAAQHVRFWNDDETRKAVAELTAISPAAVSAINIAVAILVITVAILAYVDRIPCVVRH
jgi:preprotein translocase subunit Sec61beta